MQARGWKWLGVFLVLALLVGMTTSDREFGWARDCTKKLAAGDSIQQAIIAAEDHEVICVEPGDFVEAIAISKSLTILGAGSKQTSIHGTRETQSVIHIENDRAINVLIEGISVMEAMEGMHIKGQAHVILNRTEIVEHGEDGLVIEGESAIEINESVFRNNERCRISVFSQQARVQGTPNEMGDNGADLCGFAPAALRKPLVSQTDKRLISVPEDYKTLQAAVDALTPGGTITVASGTYETGLTITKPLTLQGVGMSQPELIAPPERKVVISVLAEAQRGILKNFSVKGSEGLGVLLYGKNMLLQNVQIRENRSDGLIIGDAAVVDLSHVQIADNEFNGLKIEGSARATLSEVAVSGSVNGLIAGGSAQVTLTQAQVSHHVNGFIIGEMARVDFSNVSVVGNNNGLIVGDSARVNFSATQISANQFDGIWVWNTAHLLLENSTIAGNGGNGLRIKDRASVELRNTTVSGNGNGGLWAEGAALLTIRSSLFNSNACYGLLVREFAQINLENSHLMENISDTCREREAHGSVRLLDQTQASVQGNLIQSNRNFGIELGGHARAILETNEIRDNTGWGVMLVRSICFGLERGDGFNGQVQGARNKISDNGQGLSEKQKLGGDGVGDVCPKELEFLKEP